jgi:hypothetical protein
MPRPPTPHGDVEEATDRQCPMPAVIHSAPVGVGETGESQEPSDWPRPMPARHVARTRFPTGRARLA